MEQNEHGVEILSEETCWERLRRSSVGRLGVFHDDHPAIYPINYLVERSTVIFKTRADSKIVSAPGLEKVAFEIDGFEPGRGDAWSVLIKGYGRFLDGASEVEGAERLPLFPWVDAERTAWVRIVPVEVTGRRFHVVDGVVTDGSVGWT